MEQLRHFRQFCAKHLRSRFVLNGTVLATLSFLPFGCINNSFTPSSADKVSSASPITDGDDGSGSSGSDFTISRVIKSKSSPTTTLDIIGDGSGAIGSLCSSGDDGANVENCQCTFAFTTLAGSDQQVDVDASYVELDLIRCPYTAVSNNEAEITVTVNVVDPTTKAVLSSSNEFSFNFITNGGGLDTTNVLSFAEVKRYQCIDYVFIPNMFDTLMYDPFQSEDTHVTHPLNFYATNVGGALLHMAERSGVEGLTDFLSRWECSASSNSLSSWMNQRIFSIDEVSLFDSDGVVVHSATAGTKRSTFYLAKQASGYFNVPINSMIGPQIVSTSPDSTGNVPPDGFPSIGYGAAPIATSTGERCPSSEVEIPDGYQWVKVWAFKGSSPARTYVRTATELQKIGGIICNPGYYPQGAPVFSACDDNGGNSRLADTAMNHDNLAGGDLLASRAFGSQDACFLFPDTGNVFDDADITPTLPATTGQSSSGQVVEYENQTGVTTGLSEGSDIWYFPTNDANTQDDPFQNATERLNLDTFDINNERVSAPFAKDLITGDLDGGQSRTDFLYIVSPTDVMLEDMENKTPGEHEAYYPYTYRRLEDCDNDDPEANCVSSSHYKIQYDLWTSEVALTPNPDQTLKVYPVCAIQPEGL